MRTHVVLASFIALLPASVLAQPPLSPADRTAAFKAAGFKLVGRQWQGCGDPGTASYAPGAIEEARDLNGDGRTEVVITEGSSFCYGSTESGYTLVSKQSDGTWKLITAGPGVPAFLSSKGVSGWPDIEVGGPGFCHPVHRWTGREYALHRHQYGGKACRPSR